MYIILVPLLGIFMKKRAGLRVWISVAMAVAGLYSAVHDGILFHQHRRRLCDGCAPCFLLFIFW